MCSKPSKLQTRRKQALRVHKAFLRQQAKERLLFAFFMSTSLCSLHLAPPREVWVKERSNVWWEQIVNSTFTSADWLENFQMSRSTFTHLCNALRHTIEKRDTTMRKAIPVELRVALTLWLLSTTTDYQTIGHLRQQFV